MLLGSLRKNFIQLYQPFFYIFGGKSTGKTHLLKACSNYFLASQRIAIYIPLSKAQYFSPEVLENLEQQDICLDDFHAIIGNHEWELAIFDLMNRIKESGSTLLSLICQSISGEFKYLFTRSCLTIKLGRNLSAKSTK